MSRYEDRKKMRKTPRKRAKAKPEMETKHDAEHFDQLTALNQRQSPLLRLPRELRDEIVRLALFGLSHLDLRRTIGNSRPALLAVCRQLRKETAPIYFSNTVIHREVDERDKGYFSGFDHTYKKYIKRMALGINRFRLDQSAAIERAAKLDAATSLRPGTWVVLASKFPHFAWYNGVGQRIEDLEAVFRGKGRVSS